MNGQDDETRLDQGALCALLRSAADAQIAYVKIFLDGVGSAPLSLGEALEDVANEYLRLSETVAEMRRLELPRSGGNSGRQ